jgi:hypothetical protein
MALSTYLGNKILDCIGNATNFTAPSTAYVSLHTGDPGLVGSSECTGGSYIRKAVSFTAANAKAMDNDAAVEFAGMPAATVTYIGLWDAEANGNFLWGGSNTGTTSVAAGNTFRLAVGVIDLSLT